MTQAKKKLTIALAAGGTGGHIFPAKALAEILVERGHYPLLITDKRSAQYGKFGDIEVDIIPAAGSTLHIAGRLFNLVKIMLGTAKAAYLLHMASPDVVVGFGGYPSFPTMLAATLRKYKTIIHEQNAVLGRVNKHLSPQVNAIATCYENVVGISRINQEKVHLTGNPVREAIKAISHTPYPGMDNGIRLLVTGGSQGASVFARIVPEALKALPDSLRRLVTIDQQCRKEDIEQVQHIYQEAGIQAEIAAFFEDIPERLARSHLLICRSGASTLAEVTVAGRPAILVPYPHAMDNHQMANAKAIESTGGAWVIEEPAFTPEWLTEKLSALFTHPSLLSEAAQNIKKASHPDAAEKLCGLVEQLALTPILLT